MTSVGDDSSAAAFAALERGELEVSAVLQRLAGGFVPPSLAALERGELELPELLAQLAGADEPASARPSEAPVLGARATASADEPYPFPIATTGKLRLLPPAALDLRPLESRAPARSRLLAPELVGRHGRRSLVDVSRPFGAVAHLRLVDSQNSNMLGAELCMALAESLAQLERDPEVRVIVVSGDGQWFCAGAEPAFVQQVRRGDVAFDHSQIFRALLDCPLPTIAALDGHALGSGVGLGLYADASIFAEERRYGGNYITHGIVPGGGATGLFPRSFGEQLGSEMLYSGRSYTGRELCQRGAPVEVVPQAEVLERALTRARSFAVQPRDLLIALKERLRAGFRAEIDAAIAAELEVHRRRASASRSAAAPAPDPEEPLRVSTPSDAPNLVELELQHPRRGNKLTTELLDAMLEALDRAEADPRCRALVVRGREGVFCTGMDLAAVAAMAASGDDHGGRAAPYFELLERLSTSPLLTIAAVDGRVLAGGVGLVAACDLTLATPRTTVGLPEGLFGMLPAQLLPFLIRRVGFRAAYRMTLSAQTASATEAERNGLFDELHDELDPRIRWHLRRCARIPRTTIAAAKSYFCELWIVDEHTRERASAEFDRLCRGHDFVARVTAFTRENDMPWEAQP